MNLRTHTTRPPRILAVFAHPDDETFCTGGTLARYAAGGAEIMVVSATRGDAGQIHDAGIATRRTLGQIRERELHLACERLGIRHAICLDYGDGTLAQLDPAILTRHITQFVRRFRPDIVITFGPDGGYGHPDHIAIGAATTSACSLAGDASAFPEQIAGGLAPYEPEAVYHCHFPRSRLLLRDLLVQWLSTYGRPFQGTSDFVNALPLLARELNVLGLSADHVDVQWFAAGFSIVEQGEQAGRLFLVLDGTVELLREDQDGAQHTIARLEAGAFFGQQALAHGRPSSTHAVARGSVTCLVFAPGAPTAFAGRGTSGGYMFDRQAGDGEALHGVATAAIDVSEYVEQKVAAIAAHRTQCPLTPDMLPPELLRTILGREFFVRVDPARRIETELLAPAWRAPIIRLPERQRVPAAA
jgi:LmbE family N-acetylglucosaminyl deacetylase